MEAAGPRKQIRRFGTMTRDLLELSQWLQQLGVNHAANIVMEPLHRYGTIRSCGISITGLVEGHDFSRAARRQSGQDFSP